MKKYVCDVCGWEYDPEVGVPEAGIEPGTAFEDLPEDFVCPLCGVGKDEFSEEEGRPYRRYRNLNSKAVERRSNLHTLPHCLETFSWDIRQNLF